ncbi:MAG: adenosylhomocysteinase [Eubacteriales bacterium]|nr:adenosylhomocysteinase [Eubacteriales bacterium]
MTDNDREDMITNGRRKINWAMQHMPILAELEKEFSGTKPLNGLRIAVSVHVEAKTARLALLLSEAGADIYLTGCNPLSTQDDVALALAQMGIIVNCKYNSSEIEYLRDLDATLSCQPHIVIDDGGDLMERIIDTGDKYRGSLIGICEETTTGVLRLKIHEKQGILEYPAIAVNNAHCKYLFDNRYGTGQSVLTSIMATTNLLVAGKIFVVAGYGMCGKGVALRAKALGANVIVTEIDPIKALEAMMDGYKVMKMDEAAYLGDFFVTVTGCKDVITARHYERMKNCAVLANAGHFDVEINVADLVECSVDVLERRENIKGYIMKDGRCIDLIAEGRLVNLAAGNGHPIEIMDMSFALQALCARYLAINGRNLRPGVYDVPDAIDIDVANILINKLGLSIDELTEEQRVYLDDWRA